LAALPFLSAHKAIFRSGPSSSNVRRGVMHSPRTATRIAGYSLSPLSSRRLRHHLCNYAHLYSRVWCTECITGRCTCDRLHVPAHRDSRDLVERCAARASIEARDRLAEKPRAFPRLAFKALAFGGTVLARGTLSLIRPASRSMWALRTPEGGGFLGFAFAGS